MNFLIREAMHSDYTAIAGLLHNELGYTKLNYERLCERLDRITAMEYYTTAVAELDGAVVGFIGLRRGLAYNLDDEFIQVMVLAVSAKFQNQGVGRRLLQWSEEYARRMDIHVFVVNSGLSRLDAHRFYEQNGYRKASFTFKKSIG